ncbi:MAG: 16S rRNA (cytosine(967)-C(5))-methyltransferase RsmB [Gammaproteobacteria bacterium]
MKDRSPGRGTAGTGQHDAGGALNRAMAARAVLAVIDQGATLDAALATADTAGRDDRDRAHTKALAFGAVRWHLRHQAILAELLNRPLRNRDRILEALLSVGLFQLGDPEQPDYAAVSTTVEAARLLGQERAVGLVNAALRRYQREAPALLARVMESAEARYAHPAWLIRQVQHDWPEHWAEVLEANQRQPPLWLRVNSMRSSVGDYAARLQSELGIAAATLPGASQALRLETAVAAGKLPGFAEGLVTVQDAASQLAAGLLDPQPGMRVLDACAAPGGKSTHLLEHAGGDIELTALDVSTERLRLVEANLARLGLKAQLLAGDATTPERWWDGRPFDRILVDAPCSATGVIRRHPDIRFLRRASDVPPLAARQALLLDKLLPLLRPGGQLLYSTCSLLRAENDAVVGKFLGEHPDVRELPLPDTLPGAARSGGPGRQLLPGPADTDGFYYALMAIGSS